MTGSCSAKLAAAHIDYAPESTAFRPMAGRDSRLPKKSFI